MGKRYPSVLDMVRDTADKELAGDFQQQLEEYSVSRQLFVLRNKAGLTQTELAARVGWPQNRVSKMENTSNDKMRLGDLQTYAGALGLGISVHLTRKGTAVERIKCAAFEIKRELDHLAQLAQKDAKIHEGVSNFFAEYLYNALRLFLDSVQKLHSENLLPDSAEEDRPVVYVCGAEDEDALGAPPVHPPVETNRSKRLAAAGR